MIYALLALAVSAETQQTETQQTEQTSSSTSHVCDPTSAPCGTRCFQRGDYNTPTGFCTDVPAGGGYTTCASTPPQCPGNIDFVCSPWSTSCGDRCFLDHSGVPKGYCSNIPAGGGYTYCLSQTICDWKAATIQQAAAPDLDALAKGDKKDAKKQAKQNAIADAVCSVGAKCGDQCYIGNGKWGYCSNISAGLGAVACLSFPTSCSNDPPPPNKPFGLCGYNYNNICRACMLNNGQAGKCSDQVYANNGQRFLLCLETPQVCMMQQKGSRMIAGVTVSDTTFYGTIAAGAALSALLVASAVACVRRKASSNEQALLAV